MVDISRALTIEGWMNAAELTWLGEQAAKFHLIAEIGCWMGRTTRVLADNTSGVVYAIDTWKGSAETQDELADKSPDYLSARFEHNLYDHIQRVKVIPLPLESVVAAQYCSRHNLKFGMIFIDGAHDYESVKQDILAWRPRLAPDGLLCGHDYDWGYPGVVKAVRELIAEVPKQAAGGSSIWYV
jgi:SAM-dependent methyltransferase